MKVPKSLEVLLNYVPIEQYITDSGKSSITNYYSLLIGDNYTVNLHKESICISELVDSGYICSENNDTYYISETILHIYEGEVVYKNLGMYMSAHSTVPYCKTEEEFFMQSTINDLSEFDFEGMHFLTNLWRTLFEYCSK